MQEPSDIALPAGWVPLGEYNWLTAAVALTTIPSGFIFYALAWNVFELGAFRSSAQTIPARINSGLLALAVAIALVVLFQRWRAPRPYANFDRSEVRFGRRKTVQMSEIVWAQLVVPGTAKARSVSLVFGTDQKHIAAFRLIDKQENTIDADTARLLAEVLRRSNVIMPVDKYDPKGRFAKANFPTNVTREEAVDLVLSPPKHDDDLPIPPVR